MPLPPLALDRAARRPLHLQLCDQLRRAISCGALPQRLPSTRALAAYLRVSRNTVLNAYETLTMEGVLEARTGSGTWCKVSPRGLLRHADLVRGSHYPFAARALRDPDGNVLVVHR